MYEIYTGATGVISKAEKVQCLVFLHVAEPEAQKLFRTFDLDSAEWEKINSITEAFSKYYMGGANVTVVRYQFNTFNQMTESMETYIRELCQRIKYCGYKDLGDSILWDTIIPGVKDDDLRDRLLQTPNLSLSQCLQMCSLSEHNSHLLRAAASSQWEAQIIAMDA